MKWHNGCSFANGSKGIIENNTPLRGAVLKEIIFWTNELVGLPFFFPNRYNFCHLFKFIGNLHNIFLPAIIYIYTDIHMRGWGEDKLVKRDLFLGSNLPIQPVLSIL